MAWSKILKLLAALAPLTVLSEGHAIDSRASSSACPGYAASNVQLSDGYPVAADLNLTGSACNVYGTDLGNLELQVEYQTSQRLHVKIYDAAQQVYQVPTSVLPRPSSNNVTPNTSDLVFSMTNSPFSFAVTRQSTGESLFNTSGYPLIFEDQYLGLRTSLPDNPNLYGLGETTDPFRLGTTNYSRTLWSRDAGGTPQGSNLYGNHPVYFDFRSTGTHGVFLLNSNGMDIKIDNDDGGQFLEYNTLGGVIDLYFLSGPSPKAVAAQYAQTVGNSAMMPYWSLGFHNCRYGYQDVYELAEVIANYSQANIPLETQWTDIDYMDLRKDFTLDPLRYNVTLVREVVSYLHTNNQHYILMVDPAIPDQNYSSFNNGVTDNVFLKFANGSLYQGVVWPGVTVFPDWFATGTQDWWNGEFSTFFNPSTGVDVDGLWIDMNEASNFCQYPCSNPIAAAASSGDPPTPPPVRLSAPRPIPGFGPDFQPQCSATVSFNVYANTSSGESILTFGSSPTLGESEVQSAAQMNSNNYPNWNVVVDMPADSTFTYQYVRMEGYDNYVYEDTTRSITTGACNSPVQNVQDTITTSEGTSSSKRSTSALGRTSTGHSELDLVERQSGSMLGLPGRNLISPPYNINNTDGALSSSTLNTDLIHQNGVAEYDTHNVFGTMMSATSRIAMLNRRPTVRPLVITRSTFAGAGRQVGHWLGDNLADWDHYRFTITEIQEFAALFQVPMIGADICGYEGTTTDDLCSRWVLLGAFSPFFRDHSAVGSPPHELYRTEAIAAAARAAIDIRYRLLDYAYTAMWVQSETGMPMINPMFFEYPSDSNTADLQYQYFWGDNIMVAPVTDENSTSVSVYFPNDQFYDFFTYMPINGTGSSVTISNVAFTSIPLYFKGGSIVPMRVDSANTTTALRSNNFNVVIAPSANGTWAAGALYLDDGESLNQTATSEITFQYTSGQFSMEGTFDYNPGNVVVEDIILLGQNAAGNGGTYNATAKTATYTVNAPLTGPFNASLS